MDKRSWSCLLFCIVAFQTYAQSIVSPPFDPQNRLQDLSVVNWTSEAGLSTNNLTSVFQASNGVLWLTSFNGFMSFDGRSFEVYDRNNIPFIDIDGFYSIIEETDHSLLFGSQGNGIVKLKNGAFEPLKLSKGEIPKSIRKMIRTSKGEILIGSTNVGLFKIKNDEIVQVSHPELNKSTVKSIVEDDKGIIWIGTEGEGLFSITGDSIKQFTVDNGLQSNNIEALVIDKNKTLLIGTTKGLNKWVNDKIQFLNKAGNSQINSMWIDAWNMVWLGLERGLARYNQDNEQLEVVYSKRDVDFVRITSIMPDYEGNLWITSNRSGLIRIKETTISNLSKPLLGSDRVNIVHEAKDGSVYVGTDANEIDVCKNGTCKSIPVKSLAGGNGVRDIYVDNDNSIWLATYSGIIHLRGGKEVVYNRLWGMPADDFRVIMKDSKGNFWFATRSGGLVKFRDGKVVTVYSNENGLESNYILAVVEAPNGDIYVGTHSGGLSIISSDGRIETYHLKKDDAGVLLFNVDIDERGRVWVMANLGPIHFDGDTLKPIKLKTDKRSRTFFDWIIDEKGNFLITTNGGILQLSRKSVDNFIEHKIESVPFFILDDADGMNNRECTGATRSLLSSSGKMYIPTLGGVCVIDATLEKNNFFIPPVAIAHFKTDALEHRIFESDARIAPGTSRYSFKFSVLSFTAPNRNQFRYILEGFDKEWSEEVGDNEVEYTNLPPGSYTFRVIGCNDNHIWNTTGASFTFTVLPFFHQTILFYLTIIGGVLFLLFLLYRWRMSLVNEQNEALRKVNAELDRFVYSASHDLRSPLASILGLINVARQDDHWNKQEYLGLIEKSVKKLDSFIKDIIDFSRNARLELTPEKIQFEVMIHDILEDLRYMENFNVVEKNVTVIAPVDFYSDDKRIRVILSNIIANAIKHHLPARVEKPQINIEVVSDAHHATIKIADNGPGINEQHVKDIFKMFFRASNRTAGSGLGLYIVQETVNKLGGSVSVASKIDEGTTFTLNLPSLKQAKS